MGRWDRDFKVIGRLRPLDLLRLVPEVEIKGTRVRSLEKELASASPMPRAFDLFLALRGNRKDEQSFQIEAEARPRSDTGKRVYSRWSYAHLVLGRPLECVVFYLLPDKRGRRPQSRYSVSKGATSVDFRFLAICLWETPTGRLLDEESPGPWPLAVLGKDCERRHVVRACRQIEALEDERLVSELLGVWFEVAGVRFEPTDLQVMVSRKEHLMESSTYKAIREEGRLEGKEEGRLEGRLEGKEEGRLEGKEEGRQEGMQEGQRKGVRELSKTCRTLVETKLGTLPPEAAAIDRIREPEKLGLLADQLIRAADAAAVRKALRSIER
jgi:hypothetical protein